jgi:hypothetical protein
MRGEKRLLSVLRQAAVMARTQELILYADSTAMMQPMYGGGQLAREPDLPYMVRFGQLEEVHGALLQT